MVRGALKRGKEFGVSSYCRFSKLRHWAFLSYYLCLKLFWGPVWTWWSRVHGQQSPPNKSIRWTAVSWFICGCQFLTSLVIPSPKRVPRYWFTRVHKAPLLSQSLLSLNWWQTFDAVTPPKQPLRVPPDNVTLGLPVHWKSLCHVMNLTYPWGFFNLHWIACIFRPFIGDRNLKMWPIREGYPWTWNLIDTSSSSSGYLLWLQHLLVNNIVGNILTWITLSFTCGSWSYLWHD